MRRILTGFVVCFLIVGTTFAAGKAERRHLNPQRYLTGLDEALTSVENSVDGRTWTAWSYRNGGEFDLALSVSTAPGIWSEPLLIGVNDGLDQTEPAFAVDRRGATYLAFGDGQGRIRITALQPGATQWSPPVSVVSGAGTISSPSLIAVGDTLVLGFFRDGSSVELLTFSLLPAAGNSTQSIYDGPDPTIGHTDENDDDTETEDTDTDPFTDPDTVPFGPAGG